MTTFIANGFTPAMLKLPSGVEFKEVGQEEFCQATKHATNSVGHTATIDLINQLCGSNLQVNRVSIKADFGDEIYITMVAVRLEEGKVLNSEEVKAMHKEGKIKFVKAKVYGLEGGEQ